MKFCEALVPVCLVICLIFGVCLGSTVFGVDEVEATAAIEEAEAKIVVCYQAVLEADNAGGNVTGLLDRLNIATQFLSEGKFSLGNGNFSGAVYFSGLVLSTLGGFEAEVLQITNAALTKRGELITWMFGGSIFGLLVVGVLGFFGWKYVKASYLKRLLKMKPEVAEHDEF